MSHLKAENILLRPVEISDLDALYEWENDPGIWQVSNTVNPFSRFFLEQYILNAQNNIYADKQLRLIIQTRQGDLAGTVDLFDFDAHHRRCGVGIMTAKKHRKQGYASTALDLVIDYCRKVLNLHQIYCNIDQDNPVSLALFQKKGFENTGCKKQWNQRENQWVDELFLQLLLD
ncbi:MAG: GNAT family N-acetyltransferase [Bacteroidales bacterium]